MEEIAKIQVTEEKSTAQSNTSPKQNLRLFGLDILKFLSMLFIVIHHISKHCEFYYHAEGATKIILTFLNALFLPSVNVFVFISAWLIIKRGRASFKGILKNYFEIVFYSILTYILSLTFSGETLNFSYLAKCFLPIYSSIFWFAKAYLSLLILTPLLLKIVNNLTKKEYIITISLCFILLLVMLIKQNYIFIDFYKGFSVIWFCFLFILAGFQYKFPLEIKKYWYFIIYICCLPFAYLLIKIYNLNVDYTNIFVVAQTLCLFNMFYDLKSNIIVLNKIIKYISTCTFGIYLLHDGAFLSPYFYSQILQPFNYYNQENSIIYFILFVTLTILIGILVETIRKLILKLISIFIKSTIKNN